MWDSMQTSANARLADRPRTSSPERVLDMLLSFGDARPVLTADAIGRRFGTSRSSTYRYLQILRRRDLIEEGPVAGSWRLGPGVLRLVRAVAGQGDLVTLAEPMMRQLALETGESVLLTRRSGDRAVCVACVESPQPVRIAFEPARNTPLHAGSAARVHLAYADRQDAERVLRAPLERLTPRTPCDPAVLRRELATIRRRGWATSHGEVDEGVRSLSAPVPGRDGRPVAGLTVAGPEFRMGNRRLHALAASLLEAARRLATLVSEGGGAARTPVAGAAAALRFIRM